MSRFNQVSEEDLNVLLEDRTSKNTKKLINVSKRLLEKFSEETGNEIGTTKDEWCQFLRQFYAGIRSQKGEDYSKRSMISMRYGVQKYFLSTYGIDIVNGVEFKKANEVFHAVCAKLKKAGKGAVVHKEPISTEDLQKLYLSLDLETPKGLQNKVFLDYMLYFCNRGRENLRDIKQSDFGQSKDSDGTLFVYLASDFATKNHQVDDSKSQGGRMYVTGGNLCPVSSFMTYLSKLNIDIPDFWQRPKVVFQKGSENWYEKSPVGKNVLGDKLKTLSAEAQLSKIYTNHCLRATSITVLDRSGFEARHIMAVSGHQSETSIRSYASFVDEKKKKDMALKISESIFGDQNSCTDLMDCDFLELTNSQEKVLMDEYRNIAKENTDLTNSKNMSASMMDCDFLEHTNSQEKVLIDEYRNIAKENTDFNNNKNLSVASTVNNTVNHLQPRPMPGFNFNNNNCTINIYYRH